MGVALSHALSKLPRGVKWSLQENICQGVDYFVKRPLLKLAFALIPTLNISVSVYQYDDGIRNTYSICRTMQRGYKVEFSNSNNINFVIWS